jgi:hypothetical protein
MTVIRFAVRQYEILVEIAFIYSFLLYISIIHPFSTFVKVAQQKNSPIIQDCS